MTYYGEQNIRFKKVRKHGKTDDQEASKLAQSISDDNQDLNIPLADKLSESIMVSPEKKKKLAESTIARSGFVHNSKYVPGGLITNNDLHGSTFNRN